MGEHHGSLKLLIAVLLPCLLRIINDITDLYDGSYGVFTRESVTLKRLSQIGLGTPTFVENQPKLRPFYNEYHGILRILGNFS